MPTGNNNNNNNTDAEDDTPSKLNDTFISFINADVAANDDGVAAAVAAEKDKKPAATAASVSRPPAISNRSKSAAAATSLHSWPSHNRNVSFGGPASDGTRTPQRQPFMPQTSQLTMSPESNASNGGGGGGRQSSIATSSSLHYNNDPNHPPRPVFDRQAISMRLRQAAAAPPATNPTGRVSLEDLLGQGRYESEAETNILAAFEAQQRSNAAAVHGIFQEQNQHNRTPSTTSTIFSGLPGSLSQEMVSDRSSGGNDGGGGDYSDHDNDSTYGYDPNDPDLRDIPAKSADSDGQLFNKDSSRIPSNINGSNSNNSNNGEENQALLLESSSEQQRLNSAPATTDKGHRNHRFQKLATKAYAHRRIMSVEDQLSGLQMAMSAFQDHHHHHKRMQQNDESLDYSMEEGTDSSTDNDSSSKVNNGDDGPGANATAGELLGHHAGLILDSPLHGSGGRGRLDSLTSGPGHLPTLQEESTRKEGGMDSTDNTTDRPPVVGDIENAIDQHPGEYTTANTGGNAKGDGKNSAKQHRRRFKMFSAKADKVKDDMEAWSNFFSPRADTFWVYVKRMLFYIVLPFVGIAAILFYLADNPPTRNKEEDNEPLDKASASWWLLFVVRQVCTFSIGLGLQALIIDFLCVGTRLMVHCLGPVLTLLIVQAKGWPFVTLMWGLVNFGMLYGDNNFVRHWGYWQSYVGLFNTANPSGGVIQGDWNKRVLLIGICVSLAVAMKRFLIGLYLGRQTFMHYGAQLAKVMNKMVLIAEVAQLSKRIERSLTEKNTGRDLPSRLKSIKDLSIHLDDDNDSVSTEKKKENIVINTSRRHPLTGSLMPSERMKLMQLLERWEEPERDSAARKHVSIASVLKFRNALTFINDLYPFSYQFGWADTREKCIESSQNVYSKLIRQPGGMENEMLRFETLALIAASLNGEIDQTKAKDLMRVFRPDRQGNLSVLDFVKSVDTVYKELRFLQASIDNSSQIDKSFENLVNVVFYAVVISFILSQLGFDPFSLFLSLSSIVLAFAFAIGSASAKYFEGLLFILVRRPYGIGDMVHVSNIESGTALEGSTGWTVNNVTLFETEMTWLPTMERCSVSNGSLANSRIINWARSPNARFVMFLIFPIETPYETLEIFKVAVEEYLKARPREWLALNAFRVNYLQGEKAWMRIEVVIQHRDSWQNVGTVLDSKGNFMSYCTEVQKMLGIQYKAPHLPIEMTIGDRNQLAKEFLANGEYHSRDNEYQPNDTVGGDGRAGSESDLMTTVGRDNTFQRANSNQQEDVFRSLAQAKHNIRV